MEKRAIFPGIMFTLALASFAFGTWQYFFAQSVQASATQRMAYIITTIDHSSVAVPKKQELYASIMGGLPVAPKGLGLDFSGSFASQMVPDQCVSDGQRAVCQALKTEHTDEVTIRGVCGVCNPQ